MQSTTNKIEASGSIPRRATPAVAVMLLAALALALLAGDADLFRRSLTTSRDDALGTFMGVLEGLQGPANLALVTIVPLGLAVGGGMMALGSRKGLTVMASSAGAGAFVILGNGLVA